MVSRGPHPQDLTLFDPAHHRLLQRAASDLAWLRQQGYALNAALTLVGDHYQLRERQRLAVGRATASSGCVARRQRHQVDAPMLVGQEVWVDGLNFLLTLEAIVGGGVLLFSHDGTLRDMSSVHGTYRKVEQTEGVIHWALAWLIERLHVKSLRWLIDQPVSNSGRLKSALLNAAQAYPACQIQVDLVPDPDALLKTTSAIVLTSDSVLLDHAGHWYNAAAEMWKAGVPEMLTGPSDPIVVNFLAE